MGHFGPITAPDALSIAREASETGDIDMDDADRLVEHIQHQQARIDRVRALLESGASPQNILKALEKTDAEKQRECVPAAECHTRGCRKCKTPVRPALA